MWRLCAAVLVLQLPISEGKSDEPKYDYSYDEPEYDEDGMIVRECRLSTSCAYIRELAAYLWCDDEGMAKKPVNLLATKLVRETLGQISKDSPGPWHTQKGVILHGVVALIHEKAYERGLEHYRYDEQEL